MSGLGYAINNTTFAAEQLHKDMFAAIVSIKTELTEKNSLKCTIILYKSHRTFDAALLKHKNILYTKYSKIFKK